MNETGETKMGRKWVTFILSLFEAAEIKKSYLSRITGKLLCNSHQRQKKMSIRLLLTLYRYGKVGPANGEILKQSTRNKQRNVLNIVQSIEPTKNTFQTHSANLIREQSFSCFRKGFIWGADSVVPKCWRNCRGVQQLLSCVTAVCKHYWKTKSGV